MPKHVAVIVMFNLSKLLSGCVFISDIVNIVCLRHNGMTHISFLFNLKNSCIFLISWRNSTFSCIHSHISRWISFHYCQWVWYGARVSGISEDWPGGRCRAMLARSSLTTGAMSHLDPWDGANAAVAASGKFLIFETVCDRFVLKFWADIASMWHPRVGG
jgi:hypothetical protein